MFGADREPVAIVVAAVLVADEARAVLAAPLDPAGHGRQMTLEDPPVAVDLVDGPGADHAGVGPGGHAAAAHRVGIHVAEGPVGRLAVVDVDQPLGEEGGHVGVHRRRADEDLGVAHPAQPLVALRAIGGNAEVVSALPPADVRLKLVDAGIGTGEFARPRHIGAEHDAGHGVGTLRLCRGRAGQFDVAEAVEGEGRLPDLDAAALADVGIDRRGAAEVRGIQGAVRVEHLGVPQGDLRAGGGRDLQPHHADHVLSQIEGPLARLGLA